MNNWIFFSVLALINFGLWGFFSKLAVHVIDSKSAIIYQTIGVVLVGLVAMYFMGFKPQVNLRGSIYGVLTGITYCLGCFCYFLAASRGQISSVVTLTALYPLVTIGLSVIILHESITPKQGLGIVFAIVAMVLFAS